MAKAAASKSSVRIPCVLMRGGTSRGPFFLESDLPADTATRDRVLIATMGSPHQLQVNGIGGANPLTSKVAIVSKGTHPEADVDYLFAQVAIDRPFVDTKPNCGNMLSAVGPFAIEAGLVAAQRGETRVKIYNRNTKSLIEAIVQTPDGVVEYEGGTRIDGVGGTAAPIKLNFLEATGGVTGQLFPSGAASETIQGLSATLIDYAMPMMLLRADELGLAGDETPAVLDANRELMTRIEAARLEAGQRMGLGDVSQLVVPKIGILSPPRHGGTITSRYFMPHECHKAHAVTGALCVAAACRVPGTVASKLAAPVQNDIVTIEHPSGRIDVELRLRDNGEIERGCLLRTARRIFEGNLIIPASVLAQP